MNEEERKWESGRIGEVYSDGSFAQRTLPSVPSFHAGRNHAPDSSNGLLDVQFNLVFPNTEHLPAAPPQQQRSLPVALFVPCNFARPELGVGFRHRAMLRTTVPEAPVYEDCEPESPKYNVRLSGECISAVYSVSIASSVQSRPQSNLGRGTRAPDSRHQEPSRESSSKDNRSST